MKNKIILGLVIAAVSSTAAAGVKEKKAIRGAESNIKAAITSTMVACGNDDLNVEVSWDQFQSMIDANAEQLTAKKYKPEWVISHAGDRTVSTLKALATICDTDPDYKEELANLTTIIVKPKSDFSDTKSDFSLDDTVLTANSGHYTTRKASDFVKRIKALY